MALAVIFDWFGTLAHWEHDAPSNYTSVFASFGYVPPPGLIDEYHRRWDGVDHREHSVNQAAYLAWTRSRLRTLVNECGVVEDLAEGITEALLNSDAAATMALFPDTLPVLGELRRRKLTIGICSNWGWDLRTFLQATGVAALVDTAVTSARAGFRKPHSGIYQVILDQLEVPASEAIFVGDSWEPDVTGPLAFGITAVHIDRLRSESSPDLINGSYRINSLDQLFSLPMLNGRGDSPSLPDSTE
jgi:putative hydrolase of the HAD superfamily